MQHLNCYYKLSRIIPYQKPLPVHKFENYARRSESKTNRRVRVEQICTTNINASS